MSNWESVKENFQLTFVSVGLFRERERERERVGRLAKMQEEREDTGPVL